MPKEKKIKKKNPGPCREPSDCQTLIIGETEYYTRLTKKFENRKVWKSPDPKLVMSYIPGTICEVFVKEGQVLKEGDPLVILEAMKMRNKVDMPMDGKIKEVNVSEGERIPKGHLIISIE